MIWIAIAWIVIGLVLILSIDRDHPGKYRVPELITVIVLWPLLIVVLLCASKERRDKWRKSGRERNTS